MKPEIILPYDPGAHNADLKRSNERLSKSKSYKNLSTVIVTPTRGGRSLCPRFVGGIIGLMRPMNQNCFGPIFMSGMEVGDAFNAAVEMILGHPHLRDFKYMLTIEDDNVMPPDGLLKLYENIENYDVVGGLYWTKGLEGQPMIYGDPKTTPINFVPQMPVPDSIQPCNGTGMGCTLFRMEVFKKVQPPWFVSKQSYDPASGVQCYTQDLYFYERLIRTGGKVAVDTRVRVTHLDIENDIPW